MTKPFTEWTVLPHERPTLLDENLLCVTGMLRMPPMGEVDRHMTVVRLADDRLVVYSAIALDEAEMDTLERFGTPTYLIVPSELHRMDAKVWKDRYPNLIVVAPQGARAEVEEIVPVDLTSVKFEDPRVQFVEVSGTGAREAALVVETARGVTLVVNDIIFNLANRPGMSGWLFEKLGMTGEEPHIPPVIRLRTVRDKKALRTQLERWSPTIPRGSCSASPTTSRPELLRAVRKRAHAG